jgi:hypothetical protein
VSAPYSLLDIKVMAVSLMEAGRHQQHDESANMAYVELLLYQVAEVCLNSASIIRYASPNVVHNPIRGNIQMNS